jgi:hypothetical protein
VVESGCIIREWEKRFCKTKTGQASIQEGKSDDTKRTRATGSGAKAATTPTGTSATGKTAGRESKTTSAGTVTVGTATAAESNTAPTGTTEIGAGTDRETKAAARRREEEIKNGEGSVKVSEVVRVERGKLGWQLKKIAVPVFYLYNVYTEIIVKTT